jgi:serine/threonine protein kinase
LFGINCPFYDFTEDTNARVEFLNPSYAAPELFINTEKITSACDVYSIAAILYRIIVGEIPPISFLRVGGDTIFSLKVKDDSISKETQTAILNALNWQTQKRTPSPDAFLSELSENAVKRRLSGRII